MNELRVYFDGGGNGEYGYLAVVLIKGEEFPINKGVDKALIPITNNQSEYRGLLLAMQCVYEKTHGFDKVTFIGDSQLVINQVTGAWATRDTFLEQLCMEARRMEQKIRDKHKSNVSWEWVPREQNKMGQILEKDKKQGHPNPTNIKYQGYNEQLNREPPTSQEEVEAAFKSLFGWLEIHNVNREQIDQAMRPIKISSYILDAKEMRRKWEADTLRTQRRESL